MQRRIVVLVTVLALLAALAPATMVRAQTVAATNCPDTPGWTPPASVIGVQVECWLGTTPASRGYLQYLPAGYQPGGSYPLVVFFHGRGEWGNGTTELYKVSKHGPPKLINNGKSFPAIVISPQHPTSTGTWTTSVTTAFVNYLLSYYAVDRERIYITGLSLGGLGTWDYARANRDLVAAIVPVCGGGSSTTGYEILRGLPIWAFHREGDSVVPISSTINRLKVITGVDPQPIQPGSTGYFKGSWTWRTGQLKPAAGSNENPLFTVYPYPGTGDGHDAWTAAYNNQEMWDWLFAQRRTGSIFQQDFQSSTLVASYVNATNPSSGQFNDISAKANGGTWSINQERLQIARAGSSATDNDAGLTRHTDLAGPPSVLHVTFDLSVAGWTLSPYQTNAAVLSIGNFTGLIDYGSGGVAASVFQNVGFNGKGPGSFSVGIIGGESAALPTDGTAQRVALFLNNSGAATDYRAPDGTLKPLQSDGVALWVNGAPVVLNGLASNGDSSALTDFRLRWGSADNGTWTIDNIVMRSALK